jgi:hypothetical protein
MNAKELAVFNKIPIGKILIQGSIRRDAAKWFSVPFCIARGPFGYVGYIVLLNNFNTHRKATDEILDDLFPDNSLLSYDGIVKGLEIPYYVGNRIIGFDSGMMSLQLELFPGLINVETFEQFVKRVVNNAMKAYDITMPQGYGTETQGELF